MRTPCHVFALFTVLAACSKEPAPAQPPSAPSAAAPSAPAPAAAPAAPPAAAEVPPAPVLDPVAAAEEACGQILVVAYAGAEHVKEGITRDEQAARKLATEVLAKLKAGGDFATLAKEQSDAPSSAASGGIMGTFVRSEWPAIHRPIEATVYGLAVEAIAPELVEAPYGFVIVRRCKVEKAHSRHILIRYAGAQNAGPEITRTKAEAFKLAVELQRKVTSGIDFGEVARTSSEDSSAANGGDVGTHGRGRLAAAYEEALYALKPGGISVAVESEVGFHIIQRLPLIEAVPAEEPAPAPAKPKAAAKPSAKHAPAKAPSATPAPK